MSLVRVQQGEPEREHRFVDALFFSDSMMLSPERATCPPASLKPPLPRGGGPASRPVEGSVPEPAHKSVILSGALAESKEPFSYGNPSFLPVQQGSKDTPEEEDSESLLLYPIFPA